MNGNCLLQFAGIDDNLVSYAVERNPQKVGKMTSTGIEIISEERMRENPPKYLLVLPWHFREEIIAREDAFLRGGGALLFPFPEFEIYSPFAEKILITGSSGFIGKYVVRELLRTNKHVFGISRHPTHHREIPTFTLDLNNLDELKNDILMLKPDKIIHLAGISSAFEAFKNPIAALEMNGMCVAHICDILHRHLPNTQLFNASSSEIYKGHINYHIIDETIHNTYHTHPYSIAKIMGASIVEFYRETYGARFSNGILFTTESSTKSREFLLNKVAHYCAKLPETPLVLGSLNSWRNIIHPKDVARGILVILDAAAADYIISNNEDQTFPILDIVLDIFARMKLTLTTTDGNTYYDEMGVCRLIIETKAGFEEQPIKITGSNEKLRALGWTPEYSVADILDEICAPNT